MSEVNPAVERWSKAQDEVVIQYSDLALSTLAGMVASNSIDVSPDFQRRDRWTTGKQSALIESFLLNLPIPPVYLAEEAGGYFSVIDGRQRLTAVQMFLEDRFALHGMLELPELNGLRFSQLPPEVSGSLSMRPLRSATLLRQTNPEIKYLVFHRLNTAGEPLNAQEIRNVIYRGPLNDLLFELAEDQWLRKVLKIHNNSASAYRKMQDIEFALRFLTLAQHWENFSGDLARTMDQFMASNQFAGEKTLEQYRDSFSEALSRCRTVWGDKAFRRPDGKQWRDQALAGLFDAQMISMSFLTGHEAKSLASRSAQVVENTRRLFEDAEFEKSVRTGTNTPSRVKYRIEQLYKSIRVELSK